VLDRALAKRPEDRFDGILKFAWALRVAAHSVTRGHERPGHPAAEQRRDRRAFAPAAHLPLPPAPARGIDRVPRGPERIVALGLTVLALAAVVVHEGRQSRIARRAVDLERQLVHQNDDASPKVPSYAPEWCGS
jgi:hypothetical protein